MTAIFGSTQTTLDQALRWAVSRGAHPRAANIIPLYYQLSPLYEIPAEVGVSQSSWECDFWRYTGVVPASYHNMCGLKRKDEAGDRPEDHQQFPDDATGVEAHLQHLRRYGGRDLPAGRTLFDPRWSLVSVSVTSVEALGGKWAPDPAYGTNVALRIDSLRTFGVAMSAQIPGFQWHPADSRHFTQGRTEQIRGFAVHYTGGVNSLSYLSTDASTDVSATFLIKKGATLGDRGWQLVRIEDTPHTTGQPVNNFTISFEFEHMPGDPITDTEYTVMSQTILDAQHYLADHAGLGFYNLTRDEIKGHKEWVGDDRTCPDGISVDRIVALAKELDSSTVPPDPLKMPDLDPVPRDGFTVPYLFGSFYDTRGGLEIFGLFLSGVIEERGRLVQYTERARFEYAPGIPGSVQLGLVGLEVFSGRHPDML